MHLREAHSITGPWGLRWSAFALLPLIFTACSASDFRGPISTFDRAVTATGEAVVATRNLNDRVNFTQSLDLHARAGRPIFLAPERCQVGQPADNCGVAPTRDGDRFRADATDPGSDDLVEALQRYSQGLVALADAQSAQGVDAAAQRLNGALGKLAQAAQSSLGDVPAGDIAALIGATVRLAAFTYVEHRRLQALRSAVRSAAPAVAESSRRLADQVAGWHRNVVQAETSALNNRVQSYRLLAQQGMAPQAVTLRRALTAQLVADGENLRRLIANDPAAAVSEMGRAHQALAEALENPEISLESARTAVEAFYQRAKAAYDALEPFIDRG